MARRDDRLDAKVYVGRLSEDADPEELKRQLEDAFQRYGRLRYVWVARGPPRFAFVEFDDACGAVDAVRALYGSRICGVRANVALAHGGRRNEGRVGGDGYRAGRGSARGYGGRRGGRGGYGGGHGRAGPHSASWRKNVLLSCRFYANEFPDVEDAVIVKVTKIVDMGAYVTLSEYNNKEGMIPLSELSRRRIRSPNKLIRVGKSECVVVLRVDENKGYIDLSKRRVYSKDLLQCTERFARTKAINSILRRVAEQLGYKTNAQLQELYDKTAWHFDRKAEKKSAAYDTFIKALTDPTVFDECHISDDAKAKLVENIRKKLTLQTLRIRADIEVSCFAYEGIEAVKTALTEGKKCSTEEMPIQIHLFASPVFVVTAQTTDRAEGIDAVNNALDVVKNTIESFGGTFRIVRAPDIDEHGIRKRLQLMDLENESDSEQEHDEGTRAPRGLAQEADGRKAQKNRNDEAAADEETSSSDVIFENYSRWTTSDDSD